ncbi:MAG: PIG-L family deacetylase [Clostridiales bacterium]|jgi:LmbE family N-acetylglucosaminyl deacetylase|nr:PIG-L family deacetylase [Clostridiales bacterium]
MGLEMLNPPSITGIKKALFIAPHPDDNEIGAGGLMARLVAQGVEVYGMCVTDDRSVCPKSEWKDGLTVRQNEQLAALSELGAKSAGFLGFDDKTSATVEQISDALVERIRELKPDAVFSVDPTLTNECHRDHLKVGQAVRMAVMDAVCNFYPYGKPSDPWKVEVLGQYFTAEPNVIVDITNFAEKKISAMKKHVSQMDPELLGAIELQGRLFGKQGGVKHGEALKLYSFFHLHCFNLPINKIKKAI